MSDVSAQFPNEIWEQIFSHLLPTGPDLIAVEATCRRFSLIIKDFRIRLLRSFEHKLLDSNICFTVCPLFNAQNQLTSKFNIIPNYPPPRSAQSGAVLDDDFFIFGGFSDNDTSFNDLWRFQSKRLRWHRVISTVTPQPKGGAILLAHQRRKRLILTGGLFGSPNITGRLPGATPDNFRDELHIFNVSILPHRWHEIVLSDRPRGRSHAAGAIMEEIDILVIDGGKTECEEDSQMFILDMEREAPTSWKWKTPELVGDKLPIKRVHHHIISIGNSSFIIGCEDFLNPNGSVPRFFHCCVQVLSKSRKPEELDVYDREFRIIVKAIFIAEEEKLPPYILGSKMLYNSETKIIYWLSPVCQSKSNQSSRNGLGLHRLRLSNGGLDAEALDRCPSLLHSPNVRNNMTLPGLNSPHLLGHPPGPTAGQLALHPAGHAHGNQLPGNLPVPDSRPLQGAPSLPGTLNFSPPTNRNVAMPPGGVQNGILSVPPKQNPNVFVPCLVSHSLVRIGGGLLLFGGAIVDAPYAWQSVERLFSSQPRSHCNSMYFIH